MFNKNQHKLKARGWATQTELVCQDHNRGFVISLYIIFFIFSSISVSFSSISFLVLSNLCYHIFIVIFCVLFSFFRFFQNHFYTIMFQLKLRKLYRALKQKRTKKVTQRYFLQNFLATCLLIKFTSLY